MIGAIDRIRSATKSVDHSDFLIVLTSIVASTVLFVSISCRRSADVLGFRRHYSESPEKF